MEDKGRGALALGELLFWDAELIVGQIDDAGVAYAYSKEGRGVVGLIPMNRVERALRMP